MGAIDICVGKSVGVAETQINVGLCCEVEYSINTVLYKAVHYFIWMGDVSMIEREVSLIVKYPCVVQGGTIVKVIKRNNIICIRVGQCKMPYKPAGTAHESAEGPYRSLQHHMRSAILSHLHESCPSRDHNVLNIW